MKRIVSFALCAAMLVCSSVAALAANTNSLTLRYANTASYEIVIPTSLDIESNGKGEINVEIDNAKNLSSGKHMVTVTISSDSYEDGMWHLSDSSTGTEIGYSLKHGYKELVNDKIALTFEEDGAKTIDVDLEETDSVGVFTDTLTFSSEVAEIIRFTTNSYGEEMAVKGMTWREWIGTVFDSWGEEWISANVDLDSVIQEGADYTIV